jgi:hypothetical protein
MGEAEQLNFVSAAKAPTSAGFLLVSFRRTPGISFPLGAAKTQVATLSFQRVGAWRCG